MVKKATWTTFFWGLFGCMLAALFVGGEIPIAFFCCCVIPMTAMCNMIVKAIESSREIDEKDKNSAE